MNYISENHNKHLLVCHLIFVCKYRKKLLGEMGGYVKGEVESIANEYGWGIIEQEIDQDHIHILIRYSPKWSVLEIVRLLKQLTTYRIWQTHRKHLSRHFWKERTFWAVLVTLVKKQYNSISKHKGGKGAYIP